MSDKTLIDRLKECAIVVSTEGQDDSAIYEAIRAYAAGQTAGGGDDLGYLVTLAAGHHGWCTTAPVPFPEIADDCQLMLNALKAQAGEAGR